MDVGFSSFFSLSFYSGFFHTLLFHNLALLPYASVQSYSRRQLGSHCPREKLPRPEPKLPDMIATGVMIEEYIFPGFSRVLSVVAEIGKNRATVVQFFPASSITPTPLPFSRRHG